MRLDATAARVRKFGGLSRWLTPVLACVLGAYAAATLIYNPLTQSLFGGPVDSVPLADFGSFYASGQAAGQGLDPYAVYPLTMDAALGRGTGAAVNLNAPISLPLFQALTVLDPASARGVWFVIAFAAYALTLALLTWRYPGFRGAMKIAWAIALTGFVETVLLGQVYALLALASTAAVVLMRGRGWWAAAVLIGWLVAFKPNFVVWPVLLVLCAERRPGLVSLVLAFVFSAAPVVLYGPSVYGQWLAALRLDQVNTQVANASLEGLFARAGLPPFVGVGTGVALLALLAVWALTRRPDATTTSGVALAGLLLASPIAWVGYTLFLLPIVARARASLVLVLACAVLCIPRLALQDWATALPLVGAAYTVGWVLLLVVAFRD